MIEPPVTTLDILGVAYTLRLVELPTLDTGQVVHAYCDNYRCEIVLKRDMPQTQALYILLHEVLHALTFMGHLHGLRPEGPDDCEAEVDATASLLAGLLKGNAELFLWLLSGVEERG